MWGRSPLKGMDMDAIHISSDSFRMALKEIRSNRKLSQTDLAKKIGLLPSAISHFETGRRSPRLLNLWKLCKALNVTPNELLGLRW